MSLATVAPHPSDTEAARHWEVCLCEQRQGLTRMTGDAEGVHVSVRDRQVRHWAPTGAGTPSVLTADLRRDGSVHLVACCAPPALVLTAGGPWLFPADADPAGDLVLEPGDVLVMCSASVLDAHPDGVVALLSANTAAVREAGPRQLADTLLSGALSGAVAVARRLPG